jgi:hypothetical protein
MSKIKTTEKKDKKEEMSKIKTTEKKDKKEYVFN